jgi:hypothetical protein
VCGVPVVCAVRDQQDLMFATDAHHLEASVPCHELLITQQSWCTMTRQSNGVQQHELIGRLPRPQIALQIDLKCVL